jgi:hypothetical protein
MPKLIELPELNYEFLYDCYWNKGLTAREISNILDRKICYHTILRRMKKLGIKPRNLSEKAKNSFYKGRWISPTQNLTREKSCNYKGYNEISLEFFNRIRSNACTRDYDFDISIEYIWDIYEKQNRKCAISDLDISLPIKSKSLRNGTVTASLDRINSSKGYIESNIQWVHKNVNLSKLSLNNKEYIIYCLMISSKINFVKSNHYTDNLKKEYDFNWSLSYYRKKDKKHSNIRSETLTRYRIGALKRDIDFDLNLEDLWYLFKKQNGKCYYSGVLLELPRKRGDKSIASLDRIDNTKSYNIDNCAWCHKDINLMKRDFDLKYFYTLCNNISLKWINIYG